MIHLDTNYLVQALVSDSTVEGILKKWLETAEEVGISSIAWSEFLCGPLTPEDEALAAEILSQPEPFLASDARRAADLFNATGRRSRSLADCQIAAVAIRCGARLATSNTADFSPFLNYGLNLV